MIKIIRNDGEAFVFDDAYKIIRLDGFGGLTVQMSKEEKAFGDGDIELGERIPSRQLVIDARSLVVTGPNATRLRQRVTSFFNNDYKFKIYVNYKNINRVIEAKIQNVIHPTANIYRPQVLTLVFDALDPMFKSVDTFAKDIASKKPLLGFPVYFMAQRMTQKTPQGMAFGIYSFSKSVDIINNGDKQAYFTAEVKAKDTVRNFKLIQDEQHYFLFKKDLKLGDVLTIDFENSYVELNGVNSNQFVDKKSTFFTIPRGHSTIAFDADEGSTQLSVTLYYQERYLGV